MFSGTISLESFFNKYQVAKQKGNTGSIGSDGIDSFISDSVKRAKDRLLSNQGTDIQKAESLQELLFLQMQGLEINWADFPISEIMMSDNYSVKLLSYLAASQFWAPGSDVIMMVVSCINKDLLGADPLKKSLSLTLIPLIATAQFAEDIVANVAKNFNNPRNDIRQKAITCFYQLCFKYPSCLPAGFKAINVKEVLSDKDSPIGVVQAILTLLNELCTHRPSNFQTFLPTLTKFFLQPGGSPWVLVRTLSIVNTITSSLDPNDAQLFGKKITSQISEVLDTASSASVVFEVIKLICSIPINHRALLRSAAERAQSFIENTDPNLRYLGLISMTRLMQLDQKIISHHREVITNSLQSDDQTCVIIAVDLLQSIASRKNIADIVLNLVQQIENRSPGIVRDALVSRVIEICSYEDYERITDFEWYINVLFEIQSFGVESKELSDQLLAISLRVESVRETIINELIDFMKDPNVNDTNLIITAAFVLGEYSTEKISLEAFELLLSPKISSISPSAQASCIQNAFKIYAKSPSIEISKKCGQILLERLHQFTSSRHTEVQERATMFSALVSIFQQSPDIEAIQSLYSIPMKAISSTAQSKVKIPSTLDLSTPIIDLEAPETIFKLDDLDEEIELTNESSRSMFLLQPSKNKKNDNKPTSIFGNSTQETKKRRLQPLENKKTILAPLEDSDNKPKSKIKQSISPISQIDFDFKTKGSDILPELKPYSQDDLIAKQNRQMLGSSKVQKQEINSIINKGEIFREIGESTGISVVISDIQPRSNGLDIFMNIINISSMPISAIEFTLDDHSPQCLRQEIPPNENIKHKLIYKTQTIYEPKIIKLTVLPTGGAGEMLRGKIRITPLMFQKNPKISDFETSLNESKYTTNLELGTKLFIQPTIKLISEFINGITLKKELDGKKVVAIFSKSDNDSIILLLHKDEEKFVLTLMTTNQKLTTFMEIELKNLLTK